MFEIVVQVRGREGGALFFNGYSLAHGIKLFITNVQGAPFTEHAQIPVTVSG